MRSTRSLAVSLLSAIGLGHMFRQAIPAVLPEGSAKPSSAARDNRRGSFGRSIASYRQDKEAFNGAVEKARDLGIRYPTPLSVARKANLGTLTLPRGRRGLQVKRVSGTGRKSVYVLTA